MNGQAPNPAAAADTSTAVAPALSVMGRHPSDSRRDNRNRAIVEALGQLSRAGQQRPACD